MASARTILVSTLLLVAAACTSASPPTPPGSDATESYRIPNHGGSREGHTPTDFAGTGTGLFVGDNLNPGFPEGVGVQTYLTFEIPSGVSTSRAVIRTDALHVAGTPFDDLGHLLIEPVQYSAFGPQLFDASTNGPSSTCILIDATHLECDVTASVQDALRSGSDTAQFRLRFEHRADNDAQQDLVLFYRSDSNTNEAGIFVLDITPSS